MTPQPLARVLVAALIFGSVSVFAVACSDTNASTTTAAIQQQDILSDNDLFSAVVAGNYNISQVASDATSLTSGDGGAGDFAAQEISDSNAALVRLYGTSDINPADGTTTATLGGLGAAQGLTPVSNSITDALNLQAAADGVTVQPGSATPDYDYVTISANQNSAMIDLVSFALSPTDGGADLTNAALIAELNTELTTFNTNLTTALALQAILPAPAPASP